MRRVWLAVSLAAACAAPRPAARPAPPVFDAAGCTAADPQACVDEGRRRTDAGHPEEAVPLYRGACARGASRACQWLGERLRDGNGAAPDLAGAFAAFQRACDAGVADGCLSLGELHERRGAAELPRAIALYEHACYVGVGDACHALALLYADGRGVAKDDRRAAALDEQGCRARGPAACFAMAQRFYDGESRVEQACCAVGLLLRACAAHHEPACKAAALICAVEPAQVIAAYQQACGADPYVGCELVRDDRY